MSTLKEGYFSFFEVSPYHPSKGEDKPSHRPLLLYSQLTVLISLLLLQQLQLETV